MPYALPVFVGWAVYYGSSRTVAVLSIRAGDATITRHVRQGFMGEKIDISVFYMETIKLPYALPILMGRAVNDGSGGTVAVLSIRTGDATIARHVG
jgi:predicted RecA/RadA family phage recombinase